MFTSLFHFQDKIEETYEITRITSWINELGLKRIAIQFPDQLLTDAPDVALRIQKTSQCDVNILGDTSYGRYTILCNTTII